MGKMNKRTISRDLCVGAEVFMTGIKHKYVVTKITDTSITCLRKDGTAFRCHPDEAYTTGRWIDVGSVLDQIGE